MCFARAANFSLGEGEEKGRPEWNLLAYWDWLKDLLGCFGFGDLHDLLNQKFLTVEGLTSQGDGENNQLLRTKEAYEGDRAKPKCKKGTMMYYDVLW